MGIGTGMAGSALLVRSISKRRNTRKARMRRAVRKTGKRLSEAHKKAISRALKGRRR